MKGREYREVVFRAEGLRVGGTMTFVQEKASGSMGSGESEAKGPRCCSETMGIKRTVRRRVASG